MTRRMKRGYKQNRMRNIWKSIKQFYKIAADYNEFTELCCGFYYDTASADVDMPEFMRIVKAVGACR